LTGLEGTYAVTSTAPGYLQHLWDATMANGRRSLGTTAAGEDDGVTPGYAAECDSVGADARQCSC